MTSLVGFIEPNELISDNAKMENSCPTLLN